jgi:hypothetical protein
MDARRGAVVAAEVVGVGLVALLAVRGGWRGSGHPPRSSSPSPTATPSPTPGPTYAAARALLDDRLRRLRRRDVQVYCAEADGSCAGAWDEAGGDRAVPREPPRLVAAERYGDMLWAFELCGRNGLGDAYDGMFVVIAGGGRARVQSSVFWDPTQSMSLGGDVQRFPLDGPCRS